MTPASASDPIPDDELEVLLPRLEKAGLVETWARPDGQTAFRLTDLGERVGWMLAMRGDHDDVVLGDLLGSRKLDAGPSDT